MKAESVLPEPVGAEMRTSSPARIARPAAGLRLGGRGEGGIEPLLHQRVEKLTHVRNLFDIGHRAPRQGSAAAGYAGEETL